ncbi:MAG: hypothetical protein ACPG4X_18575 [Pikeienuella sp.]
MISGEELLGQRMIAALREQDKNPQGRRRLPRNKKVVRWKRFLETWDAPTFTSRDVERKFGIKQNTASMDIAKMLAADRVVYVGNQMPRTVGGQVRIYRVV